MNQTAEHMAGCFYPYEVTHKRWIGDGWECCLRGPVEARIVHMAFETDYLWENVPGENKLVPYHGPDQQGIKAAIHAAAVTR